MWNFPHMLNQNSHFANYSCTEQTFVCTQVLLIDTSSDEDVCIGTELIRAGHADTRADSALRVSVGSEDEEGASDVSASASEVVGRSPRRLRTWDAEERAPSTLARLAALSNKLSAAKHSLHSPPNTSLVSALAPSTIQRARQPPPQQSTVDAETVVTNPILRRRLELIKKCRDIS